MEIARWDRTEAEDRSGTLRLLAALVFALALPVALVFPGYTLVAAFVLSVGGLLMPTVLSSKESARGERMETPAAGAAIEERQEAAA